MSDRISSGKRSSIEGQNCSGKQYRTLCAELGAWYETALQEEENLSGADLTGFLIRQTALFLLREKGFSFEKFPLLQQLSLFSPDGPGQGLHLKKETLSSLEKILGNQNCCVATGGGEEYSFLGTLFETLLAEEHCGNTLSRRKQTGSFYTPENIVTYMVQESILVYLCCFAEKEHLPVGEELLRAFVRDRSRKEPLPEVLISCREQLLVALRSCRLLDPACGSGAFLLGAHRVLLQLWNKLQGTKNARVQYERSKFLMEHVLHGMDIQLLPLQILELDMVLTLAHEYGSLPERLLQLSLIHCNALFAEENCSTHCFDVILGNPPYVPITAMTPEERSLYKKHFFCARGRFNLFTLFLEKSAALLNPDGVLFFLVPDRVLLNTQSSPLLDHLFQRLDLYEWITFDRPIFPAASVDVMILGFRKKLPSCKAEHPLHRIRCKNLIPPEQLDSAVFTLLEPEQFRREFSGSEHVENLWKRIREKSIPLGSIARIRDGIIQGAVGDVLFLKDPDLSTLPCGEKLLYGRNVTPYCISFENNFVDYSVEKMKKLEYTRFPDRAPGLRMRSREIFACRKILTRQTADRIIAALDDSGTYFYANTLHGTVLTDESHDLYFILGVMNSALSTFLYRSLSMEKGKTFAQIKIALLQKLPIPVMEKKYQEQISSLVKQILSLSPNKNSRKKIASLTKKIDLLLYEFYCLTEEELRLVEGSQS